MKKNSKKLFFLSLETLDKWAASGWHNVIITGFPVSTNEDIDPVYYPFTPFCSINITSYKRKMKFYKNEKLSTICQVEMLDAMGIIKHYH